MLNESLQCNEKKKSNSNALNLLHQSHSTHSTSAFMKCQQLNDTYIYSQNDDENETSEKSLLGSRKSVVRTQKSGETRKTLVAVLYFGFICLTKAFVQTIVHDRVPDMRKYPPLPDLILDNLPLMPWAFFASELIGLFFGILFFTIVLFHKHRYERTFLAGSFGVTGHFNSCQFLDWSSFAECAR